MNWVNRVGNMPNPFTSYLEQLKTALYHFLTWIGTVSTVLLEFMDIEIILHQTIHIYGWHLYVCVLVCRKHIWACFTAAVHGVIYLDLSQFCLTHSILNSWHSGLNALPIFHIHDSRPAKVLMWYHNKLDCQHSTTERARQQTIRKPLHSYGLYDVYSVSQPISKVIDRGEHQGWPV